MAGLRDLLKKGTSNGTEARKIAKVLGKNYPIVAEILGGAEAKGDEAEISPGTITIFIHEGKARFSANVKSQEKTFIGDIGDLANPWGSIESALAMGDVSSKRYSGKSSSLSEEQKSLIL